MHFTYLLGVLLIFFPIWLFLYISRKDLRQEILFMGSFIAVGALFLETFVWTKDWWQPKTITATIVGIEDVMFGFFMGGIIVSIYEEVFRKKLIHIRGKRNHHLRHFLIVVFLSIFIGNFTFFYLKMHSFYSSILSMLIPTIVIYFYRKDLIPLSVGSGLIVALISVPVFWIGFFFDPTAINFWDTRYISSTIFLGVPIADVIWFFTTGTFLAPLYEFWKGKKLEKITA